MLCKDLIFVLNVYKYIYEEFICKNRFFFLSKNMFSIMLSFFIVFYCVS